MIMPINAEEAFDKIQYTSTNEVGTEGSIIPQHNKGYI
jgi:hypothetical protein